MGAARESDEMFNDLYTDTMKTFGKLNNISEAYLPSIKSRDSQFLMLENIAYLEPIMLDMKIKFLINNTSQKFILSDDPVVVHNQFAENHPRFKNALNTAGLAVRGLQMFFPVSPTLCIAMYDPGRYEYGKKNGQICTVSELDVSRLNLLQVLNTDRCIYSLPGSYTQEQLTTLADLGQNYAPHAPRVESSELVEAPGGGYTQTVLTIAHYIRTGFKFSFVRVIDSERYSDHPPNIVPVRSPFNIELSHAWKDKLQKQYMKQAQTETQAIHDPDQAAKVVQPSGFQKEGDQ